MKNLTVKEIRQRFTDLDENCEALNPDNDLDREILARGCAVVEQGGDHGTATSGYHGTAVAGCDSVATQIFDSIPLPSITRKTSILHKMYDWLLNL